MTVCLCPSGYDTVLFGKGMQDDKNNNEFVATSQQFQDNEIMSKY